MLRTTDEGQKKKLRKSQKQRSLSQEGKLDNKSPSPNKLETAPKQYQLSTLKRSNSPKLTKDEIKYQRFVGDLKKEIRFFLARRLRENRFDPSGKQNPTLDFTVKSKRATSSLLSHQANETPTVNTSPINRRHYSMKTNQPHDIGRLTNDVQTLLTEPSFKTFYTQFIQSPTRRTRSELRLHPLVESYTIQTSEE